MSNYLYHYTKAETLELILQSKKIRFSSLSCVDDLEEQFTKDLYDYAKHVFVACFTNDKKESIPIWNMYSKGGQGVRLTFDGDVFDKIFHHEGELYVVSLGTAFPVNYTEDEAKLYPNVIQEIKGEIGHNVSELGKFKRTAWDFQNEWRYRIIVYRGVYINNELMVDERNIPITYFDAPIKKETLNNMEITLGYNLDNEYRTKITKLVNDFNKAYGANIKISESCFLHKIR